jgi:glutathione synthase/RimK-type ligase-like ATP-grasp enzyme
MFYILRKTGLGNTTCRETQKHFPDKITIIKSLTNIQNNNENILLRWGTTQKLPINIKVLNTADNISTTSNKTYFRNLCQTHFSGITPKTWFDINDPNIIYPIILRPESHAQGKHLYLCKNKEELKQNLQKLTNKTNYYISEYINKAKEFRIFFIQGKVVWIAEKIPKHITDIAWNVAQGGKFINVPWKQWNINLINDAYKIYNLSKLWLGGVDIIQDGHNNFIIEINSAPNQTNPYKQQYFTKTIN